MQAISTKRKNITNYPSVEDVADSLERNNGPLENRRAVPRGKVDAQTLGDAIAMAEARGMMIGWKVWHFDSVDNKWSFDADILDALTTVFRQRGIIESSIDPEQLGKEFNFTSLTKLQAAHMNQHVQITVGDRSIEVPISGLFALKFRCSPYEVARWYIEQVCGSAIAAEFKPYHMSFSSREVLQDSKFVGEVIGKQLRRLQRNEPGVDLLNLALNVGVNELSETFTEKIGASDLVVNPLTIFCHHSALAAVQYGLIYLGFEKFSKCLQPYHRLKASNGTWDPESEQSRAVLVRYLDQVTKEHYHGCVVALVRNFTPTGTPKSRLVDTLVDPVTNKKMEIEIPISSLMSSYENRRWQIVTDYLRSTRSFRLLQQLRPYHLVGAVRVDHATARVSRRELFLRHMNRILSNPPYDSDGLKFARSVTSTELQAPFLDELAGGITVEVNTRPLYDFYEQSPRKMVRAYLRLTNQIDILTQLNENPRTSKKPFQGRSLAEEKEILFGAIDRLIQTGETVTYRSMRKPYQMPDAIIATSTAWRHWAKSVSSGSQTGGPLALLVSEYEIARGLPENSVNVQADKRRPLGERKTGG